MDNLKLGLVLSQILNFGIIFFVFKYYLGEKIVAILNERRKHLQASENAEDEAKKKLEEAELQKQKIIDAARLEAAKIEETSEELAKQNASKIMDKAEKDAAYQFASARDLIEKEKLDMKNSMKDNVLGLALKMNEKIFGKQSANKDFMDKEYDLLNK